ncbi:MAG: hypothetical protein WC401_04745 [Bacteroidales bacterium]|jgi:hypothetical protein|nr:hypothetical protein [Bacteroidales bacterium]
MRCLLKIIVLIFLPFWALSLLAQTGSKTEGHLFYQGKLVNISIDKYLYVTDSSDFFYIHVFIKNVSGNMLGIDLSNSRYFLYPNQWQFSDNDFRSVIDETQIIPAELDAKKIAEIGKKIKDKQLNMVLPGQTFDYYTEFNAAKPKSEDMVKYKYLIIAIDGQMFFTDGSNIEQVKCNGDMIVDRELAIPCPFTWQKIQEKQKILNRK